MGLNHGLGSQYREGQGGAKNMKGGSLVGERVCLDSGGSRSPYHHEMRGKALTLAPKAIGWRFAVSLGLVAKE